MIKKTVLNYSEVGYLSDIVTKYLDEDHLLKPFYKYAPNSSSFKQIIEDKKKENINRQLLVEVLKSQNSEFRIQNLVEKNIEALLNPNTFTVTTGHQLCLFTGPLYFIYKIISTINLAEELKKEFPEYNFVPVYWMVSEDHDFAEINHIHLFGKKLEWNSEHRILNSIAGITETNSLKNIINELKIIIGESENAKKIIPLFEDAYLKNKNLADATRCLVNELFGEYGLVIIDANDARLKNEFKEEIKDDIFNNSNFKIVNSTIQKLHNLNFKTQVNPREINCFCLIDGQRERIVFENSKFIPSKSGQNSKLEFSEKEILFEIENYPERFSPNVVLRPLYQQKILPNLAYIGGAAEIAYWLEYKSMFEFHNIGFPLLLLRNSVMWLDKKTSEKIRKLKLNVADFFKNENEIIKSFLKNNSENNLNLEVEKEKIKSIYNKILQQVEKIDRTLKPTVEAELQKQLNSISVLENKIFRAEKQKQEVNINQIKKLKEKLFPNQKLQERHENFIPYFLEYGNDFIKILKKELNVFEKGIIVLEEES